MHIRQRQIDRHIKQALGPQEPQYLRVDHAYGSPVTDWKDIYPTHWIILCFSSEFSLGNAARTLVEYNCDWIDIADALMGVNS